MDVKQVIVMRTDLNMRKGKMAAQAAHASMKVILDQNISAYRNDRLEVCYDPLLRAWLAEGTFKKIVVGVNSEALLMELYNRAETRGMHCSLIKDNGLTEFNGIPTVTCIAIGPEESEKLDLLTGNLKLL